MSDKEKLSPLSLDEARAMAWMLYGGDGLSQLLATMPDEQYRAFIHALQEDTTWQHDHPAARHVERWALALHAASQATQL